LFRKGVSKYAELLQSDGQLGVGSKGGMEASILAAQHLLHENGSDENMGLLKVDFSNAFNSVSRDVMLSECRKSAVELYPFVKWCYSTPSTLWINDQVIDSQEGVQQGDPLGPFLFCLVLRIMTRRISSSCNDLKLILGSWMMASLLRSGMSLLIFLALFPLKAAV
jgi:hypothetical protein